LLVEPWDHGRAEGAEGRVKKAPKLTAVGKRGRVFSPDITGRDTSPPYGLIACERGKLSLPKALSTPGDYSRRFRRLSPNSARDHTIRYIRFPIGALLKLTQI